MCRRFLDSDMTPIEKLMKIPISSPGALFFSEMFDSIVLALMQIVNPARFSDTLFRDRAVFTGLSFGVELSDAFYVVIEAGACYGFSEFTLSSRDATFWRPFLQEDAEAQAFSCRISETNIRPLHELVFILFASISF